MATTPTYINQRINNLQAQINAFQPYPPPETQTLSQVLANGNSAGTFSIDMNNQDITAVDNIDLVTINGSAYPPPSTPSSSVFNYKAHTTSQAPPISNGEIEWNNLTQSSATQIYISHQDDDGDDIQVLLSALPLGTIFLIQDQAIGSNYQRWTITSISSVINQYITFGVTLLTSTHSFSNNDPVLLIIQSANQNLEQVLAVGNSAGAYSINMNTQAISNISTATAKTSVVVNNSVAGQSATLTTQNLTINTGGLTNNPIITLNQSGVGNGLLIEELYNQRNATTGEFNRLSFFAKAGTTKTEYARIQQLAPVVTDTANARGQMDFQLYSGSGVMSSYLSLNASSQEVSCLKNLNMNLQNISNALNITAPNSIPYGKANVEYYTSTPSNFPNLSPYPDTRASVINLGVPDTIEPLTASFPSTWGNITAIYKNFNTYTFVGTDNGFLYYSSDGNTWYQVNVIFDGAIRCMAEYNGYLYIGGEFNNETVSGLPCFYIARIDTGYSFSQVDFANYSGSYGFNNKVYTLCAGSNGYLYIGGAFDRDKTSSLSCPYIAILDGGITLYCMDNSFGTGYGFNATINFIIENGNAPNKFVIGGEFTNISTASYGTPTVNYNCVWESNDYNTANPPYEVVSMNNFALSATNNGPEIYVGGLFQGLPYGDYLADFQFDGSNYIIAPNPYGFSATEPINLILQDGGIFWTYTSSYSLYANGNFAGVSPTGSAWSAISNTVWGQPIFSTISPSQNPIIAYYINTSDVITINFVGGYLVQYATSNYSGGIILYAKGSSVDMIYHSPSTTFYVVNQINSGFF